MSFISGSGSSYYQTPDPNVAVKPVTPSRTGVNGTAKINGLQTITSLPVPNDGQSHAVSLAYDKVVSVLEVQGAVQLQWILGGIARSLANIDAGGSSVGLSTAQATIMCDPGTTVTVAQTSALTGGASVVFAGLTLLS